MIVFLQHLVNEYTLSGLYPSYLFNFKATLCKYSKSRHYYNDQALVDKKSGEPLLFHI